MECTGKIVRTVDTPLGEIPDAFLTPFVVKRYRSFDPTPVSRRNEVVLLGRLKEGNEVYSVVMGSLVGVSEVVRDLDPPSQTGAGLVAGAIALSVLSGPASTTTNWDNCRDSSTDCTVPSGLNYGSSFYASSYGPYMFIFNTALASPVPSAPAGTSFAAYAKPCPVASTAPDLSGFGVKIPNNVLLKGFECTDTANRQSFSSFSALDNSTNSYTIAAGGMGTALSSTSVTVLFGYNLSSTVTKGSTDIYYYIYRIGVQY